MMCGPLTFPHSPGAVLSARERHHQPGSGTQQWPFTLLRRFAATHSSKSFALLRSHDNEHEPCSTPVFISISAVCPVLFFAFYVWSPCLYVPLFLLFVFSSQREFSSLTLHAYVFPTCGHNAEHASLHLQPHHCLVTVIFNTQW